MKLDPRHLEILAAIVDRGGLTEGAELLGKSQPSVSRTLAQLEARVGMPLFEPGRRPLRATELGLALAEHGRMVLTSGRAASEIVGSHRSGHAGLVRVAGTPIFMDGVIATIIARFQERVPSVRVDLTYGYVDDLAVRLRNGTLDVAVLPLRPDRVPADMDFQPILSSRNVIACRDGHPLTRLRLLTPKDIAHYPWIAPPQDSPLYRDLRRALERVGVDDFRISFSGGTLASVLSVLNGSDSLTVLPYSVVFMEMKSSRIAALPLEIGHPERTLGLLVPRTIVPSPAVGRFQRFLVAEFEALGRRIAQHQKDRKWR